MNILTPTLKIVLFFNHTATTEIYTLSLHDALPICSISLLTSRSSVVLPEPDGPTTARNSPRSEEHTSELQSLAYLVCRLLLEQKKKHKNTENKKKKIKYYIILRH